MNRRDAISRVALILGGTVVGANIFLEGCKPADKKVGDLMEFSAQDISYLDEVAETILPATSTPGAKAAKVGQFMTVMVADCYTKKDQEIFREGMNKINEASNKKYEKNFMGLVPAQRHELLVAIDTEAKDYTRNKKPDDNPHYFRLIRELTLLGYFTSEIGQNQALRYVETPGKYEGCIPYNKGDKAWAIG